MLSCPKWEPTVHAGIIGLQHYENKHVILLPRWHSGAKGTKTAHNLTRDNARATFYAICIFSLLQETETRYSYLCISWYLYLTRAAIFTVAVEQGCSSGQWFIGQRGRWAERLGSRWVYKLRRTLLWLADSSGSVPISSRALEEDHHTSTRITRLSMDLCRAKTVTWQVDKSGQTHNRHVAALRRFLLMMHICKLGTCERKWLGCSRFLFGISFIELLLLLLLLLLLIFMCV